MCCSSVSLLVRFTNLLLEHVKSLLCTSFHLRSSRSLGQLNSEFGGQCRVILYTRDNRCLKLSTIVLTDREERNGITPTQRAGPVTDSARIYNLSTILEVLGCFTQEFVSG